MTTFDQREKAFEDKFFHDEEIKFRAMSRRRKLMGLWAAEHMHMDEEDAEHYATKLVEFGVKDNTQGAVVNKVIQDLIDAGVGLSEAEIREKMEELDQQAMQQITNEMK